MGTITVLDSVGASQTVAKVTGTGATTGTNALPVVIATDDAVMTGMSAKLPATLGNKTAANSMAVTLASDDTIVARTPALGAAADASSSPVSLSTESKALISGMSAKLPAALGATAKAAAMSVTTATDDPLNVNIGAQADTVAAADTTSTTLIALIKRNNVNLTTLNTTLGLTNSQLPAALGSTTRAASLATVLAASAFSAAVTLTRTADTNAYAANDVLGAATGSTAALTFSSMAPAAGGILLTSVSLQINDSAVISGETTYRLHLYNVTPPSALGDNTAWDLPSGDRASYLGYVDLGTPVDLGSTLYVQTLAYNKQILAASTSIFGYLTTIGAYTPTSARVYVITLNAVSL